MPQARNSVKYQERSECLNSATCGPYCPSGAKGAMDQYQLPAAVATGRCAILKDATVLRLEWDREDRIRRAVYRFPEDPAEHAVEAPVFVLAVGGIEAARLLLLSAGPGHPAGLGNNTDQVGRCFMDHPAFNAIGEISDPVYPFRGPYQTLVSHDHYPRDGRRDGGCFAIAVQNWGGFPPSVIVELTRKWGPDLRTHLQENFGRQIALEIMVEQLPSPDQRVTLDPEKTDGYGQSLPRVTWDVGDYGRLSRDTAYDRCRSILEAAGATRIWPIDEVLWGNHHSGTARMGDDPSQSVVDPHLRIHGVENGYVCSSACFPTIGAAHPTLTVVALAHRLAAHLAS